MDFDHVIDRAGGIGKLAAQLKLSHSTVSKWRTRGIPVVRIPEISAATNVPRHELRPDLWPAPEPAPADKQAAA